MSTSIAVIKPYHEPNYVEFVTWSVLFHIGVFVALSFVHYAHTVDKPLPAVRVTIIEEPPEEPPLRKSRRNRPCSKPNDCHNRSSHRNRLCRRRNRFLFLLNCP